MQARRGVSLLLGALALAGAGSSPLATGSAVHKSIAAAQLAGNSGPQQGSAVRGAPHLNLAAFLRYDPRRSGKQPIWIGREKHGARRGRSRFNFNR